jgi:hypothetical protein
MNLLRPYKSDIKQIDSLVNLGVNQNDIAVILGITPTQLKKWKENNTRVSELLKDKALPECTIANPDFAPLVEEVFTCAGKRYYRFKNEYEMPTGRYKYYFSVLREIEMRLSIDTLREFIKGFKAVLNGGKKKSIDLTDLHKLVINMESRTELEFDTRTVRKLAAIQYFDETEDLTSYNEKHGEQKLKVWLEHNMTDFFLTRHIGELLHVKDISVESLQERLTEMDQVLTDLDFDLQTVLEANS